jgi:hypothetical protein
MHPLDVNDRRELLQQEQGLGKCNITKCCTEVCPEHIKITDNAIIPLKERVVDASYDPVAWLGRKIRHRKKNTPAESAATSPATGPAAVQPPVAAHGIPAPRAASPYAEPVAEGPSAPTASPADAPDLTAYPPPEAPPPPPAASAPGEDAPAE